MFYYDDVKLMGEIGERYFVLPTGEATKNFYNAGKFIFTYGQFPIYNKEGEIVEYMDALGNFTQDHTELAVALYYYFLSARDIPTKSMGRTGMLYCGLYDFPSKFLTDLKVREFIKQEEDRRYKMLCYYRRFNNIFTRLSYKMYIKELWHQKIKKANCLMKNEKEDISL